MSDYSGQFIKVNDLKMNYYDVGSGYPIVMIHGGSESGLSWKKVFPLLSDTYRLIAPDCRGQGKTNNPKNDFSYNLMSQDIVELINVLKIEKPIICGWSDGGQIGLELGIHFSDNIKGLVLGGTFIEIFDDYLNLMQSIGIEEPRKVNFDMLKEVLPDFVNEIIQATTEIHGKEYWKTLVENLSNMWLNPDEFPKDLVKKINIPTLIIIGDNDQFVPLREQMKLFYMIKGSSLAVAPNSDHFFPQTNPDLFVNLITGFLRQHT